MSRLTKTITEETARMPQMMNIKEEIEVTLIQEYATANTSLDENITQIPDSKLELTLLGM
jgi:hypothetical protein